MEAFQENFKNRHNSHVIPEYEEIKQELQYYGNEMNDSTVELITEKEHLQNLIT